MNTNDFKMSSCTYTEYNNKRKMVIQTFDSEKEIQFSPNFSLFVFKRNGIFQF